MTTMFEDYFLILGGILFLSFFVTVLFEKRFMCLVYILYHKIKDLAIGFYIGVFAVYFLRKFEAGGNTALMDFKNNNMLMTVFIIIFPFIFCKIHTDMRHGFLLSFMGMKKFADFIEIVADLLIWSYVYGELAFGYEVELKSPEMVLCVILALVTAIVINKSLNRVESNMYVSFKEEL